MICPASSRSRLALLAGLLLGPSCIAPAEVIRPKVVVVTMFEVGADTGDRPGEFQYWIEREQIDRPLPMPAGYRDLRVNADGSVLAILTGVGNSNAAASIMALGLDPRFDLTRSYWLVAGIGGVDPADASAGSAVWTDYVVDGDLAHEIDAREIPADWKTGFVPLRKKRPYALPLVAPAERRDNVYALNPELMRWAYALTKDVPLADPDEVRGFRARYAGFPRAQQPPQVLIGSNLSSSKYWHGRLMNEWANDWVAYYTEGRGNYVTTAMEDSGTLRALTNLTRAGRADVRRALILRTASNYDMQPPGLSAAESLAGEGIGYYSAYLPSLDAAHRIGSTVVRALVGDWARYENEIPRQP